MKTSTFIILIAALTLAFCDTPSFNYIPTQVSIAQVVPDSTGFTVTMNINVGIEGERYGFIKADGTTFHVPNSLTGIQQKVFIDSASNAYVQQKYPNY